MSIVKKTPLSHRFVAEAVNRVYTVLSLPFSMVGEVSAYVQSFGLKVEAVVSLRLTNSPITRDSSLVIARFPAWEEWTMADYNVWADLFDTWQSTSDWVKALIIVVPPVFVATMLALLLRYRQNIREDIPVHSGVYHLSAPQQFQPRPEDMPEPGDTMDHMLLDAATNLQHRLEDARRSLHPQERSGADLGKAEIRQQITQIILEEYHRGSDPQVALRRGREFLASQRNVHSTNPDA
ncbi:hypothetical protein ACQZ4Q_04100 [Agrobacterium vitis]